MDKGEERVGLLCSAGGVLVGRKFALLLSAPPSFQPFPSSVALFRLFFGTCPRRFPSLVFVSIFFFLGCLFSSGWTRLSTRASGWRLACTHQGKHTRLVQSATTCCCSVMRAWNEDGRKQGQMRRNQNGMLYRSKSRLQRWSRPAQYGRHWPNVRATTKGYDARACTCIHA